MTLDLPFSGLRILDISQGIAGPYCTQMLWQQGAQVIKVEPPEGDWGRNVGVVKGQHSALSVSYNTGKQSVCIDARTTEGKALLAQLALQADVIVQNFRPGVAERLGVGYEQLHEKHPKLVYVSISGYGPDGPYTNAPASDSVMQADSGLMYANQNTNGEPRRIGLLLADIVTALYAAQKTATALYKRAVSGVGSHIQLSLFEACTALQINNIAAFTMSAERPKGAVSAPNGVFDTADGRLSVLALNNDQFARLCRALGRSNWLTDPAFDSNEKRMQQKDELHRAIAEQLREKPSQTWVELFQHHEVLHAVVRDYESLASHPQMQYLGLMQTINQQGVGVLNLPGMPGSSHLRPLEPAPAIGQHTVEVLARSGLSDEQIASLLQAGVVRQATAEVEA